MNWWILGALALLALLLWYATRRGWVDFSDKSRGGSTAGGALHIGDEVFAPSRHEAQVELDRQTVLPAPAPLPGDGDLGIAAMTAGADSAGGTDGSRGADVADGSGRLDRFEGRIRIDL